MKKIIAITLTIIGCPVFAIAQTEFTPAELDVFRLRNRLNGAAARGDVKAVKDLLNQGANDNDDKILRAIRLYEAAETDQSLKTRYQEVVKILEQVKSASAELK